MGSATIGAGFHCGEPPDTSGIRKYFKSLALGGHTIFAKATNGTASLLDALEIDPDAICVWRKTNFEWRGKEINDVPNYLGDPERQASFYMEQIFAAWPPELDKTRVCPHQTLRPQLLCLP